MTENDPESFESRITQLQDRLKKFENNIEQKITEKSSRKIFNSSKHFEKVY